MSVAVLVVVGLALILGVFAYLRGGHAEGLKFAWQQGKLIAIRAPLALVAAGFLAEIIPQQWIAGSVGESSGLVGILIASVVGGFMPGGPMVSFPTAVVLFNAGAGYPQLVAFLTAWSVFALHRILIYELTMLGGYFCAVRLIASSILPPLTGLLAALLSLAP